MNKKKELKKCPHCNQVYKRENIADIFDINGDVAETPSIYFCINKECMGNKYQLFLKDIIPDRSNDFKYNQMIMETQKRTIQFGEWCNVGLKKDGFHFIIHDVLQSDFLEFEVKELKPLIKALQMLDEGI